MGLSQCVRRLCHRRIIPMLLMGCLLFCAHVLHDEVCTVINLTSCCSRYITNQPYTNTSGTRNSNIGDIDFLLSPSVCPRAQSPLWMVIGVVSDVKHFRLRSAVRNTWGSLVKGQFAGRIALVFIVGHSVTSSTTIENELREEHRVFGDIVQINVEEKYKNLVKKSIALLKWTSEKCANFQHVLKIDDDVFLNLPRLVSVVKMFQSEPKFIMGQILRHSKPNRKKKSKHFVSVKDYPASAYPSYINGAAYVISGLLVVDLLAVIETTPLVYVEDAFITGICGQRAAAMLIGDCGFSCKHVPVNQVMKYPHQLIFHNYTAVEFGTLWEIFSRINTLL